MLTKDTQEIQEQVGSFCKTGIAPKAPGITPNRLHHYHRLIHSILEDAIESAYPIAFNKLDSATWNELVAAFIEKHDCQHPQLFLMPGEFIDFIENEELQEKYDYPYLIDLLRFEWMEVLVHTQKDEEILVLSPATNFAENRLFFTPYMQLMQTEYPIHKLHELDVLDYKGSYNFLVYRQENGTVQYLELNPFLFSVLFQLLEQEISLNELLAPLLAEADEETKQEIQLQTTAFLENLTDLGLILGSH